MFYDFHLSQQLLLCNSVYMTGFRNLFKFYTMHKQQSQMQSNVLIVDRTQGHKDPAFIAFMLTIKHDSESDCP